MLWIGLHSGLGRYIWEYKTWGARLPGIHMAIYDTYIYNYQIYSNSHHIYNAVITKDSFILPWNFYTHLTKQEGHHGSGDINLIFLWKIGEIKLDSWNGNSAIGGCSTLPTIVSCETSDRWNANSANLSVFPSLSKHTYWYCIYMYWKAGTHVLVGSSTGGGMHEQRWPKMQPAKHLWIVRPEIYRSLQQIDHWHIYNKDPAFQQNYMSF